MSEEPLLTEQTSVGRRRVPGARPSSGWVVIIHRLSLRALLPFGVSFSSWIFELLMTPVSATLSLPLLFLSCKVLLRRLSPQLSHGLVASSAAKVKAVRWGGVRPVPGIPRARKGYREQYKMWTFRLPLQWWIQCSLADEDHNRKCFSKCMRVHVYNATDI